MFHPLQEKEKFVMHRLQTVLRLDLSLQGKNEFSHQVHTFVFVLLD